MELPAYKLWKEAEGETVRCSTCCFSTQSHLPLCTRSKPLLWPAATLWHSFSALDYIRFLTLNTTLIEHEQLTKVQTILLLIFVGVVLVFIRWIVLLLPTGVLVEALLYAGMGYLVGHHLYYEDWRWGLVMALPALLLLFYFFLSADGTGSFLKHLLSGVLIPLFAYTGI